MCPDSFASFSACTVGERGRGGEEGGHSIFQACIACAAYRGSWLMARRLHATSMHGGDR